MGYTWQLEDVPVRISLGEKTLLRPRLPLLVYKDFFTTLPPPPAPLPFPAERCNGYYVPSRPIVEPLPEVALEQGMMRFAWCYTRRLLKFASSYAEYTKKWSSRSRGNLRRRIRDFAKLTGDATPRVRRFTTPAEAPEFLAAVDLVTRRSYQSALLGNAADARMTQLVNAEAREGRLHGFVLYHGDRPVAFAHLGARERTLLLVGLAYDNEYRPHAPGSVLLQLVFEALHGDQRWDLLDFGEGDAEYKELFSTEGVPCAELFYLRFTPRNLAIMGLRNSLSGMTRIAVKALDHMGAKDRVKRLLRERAAAPPTE